MAVRANWKGTLKIDQLICPVALYTAASTADRVSFHLVNRKTGNRLNRSFVDSETGDPVDREDQIKGYEVSSGHYVSFTDDEIAAAIPESDKTINVVHFIKCEDVDAVYLDKPYYLAPADDNEAFALIRDGMKAEKLAAVAETVLFRRARKLLIHAYGGGLIATTLNFNYEVRSAASAFSNLPEVKSDREMLDLAKHIIKTRMGSFDPETFDDRYDAALAALIKAKIAGKPVRKPPVAETATVIDLKEALRKSAAMDKSGQDKKPARRKTVTRKAG